MCAHLAPRWRRRSFVAFTLLLLTVNADRETTANTSPTSSILGVVTTNLLENATSLTTRAWNINTDSASNHQENDNHLRDTRAVSFQDLVRTTPAPPTPEPVSTTTYATNNREVTTVDRSNSTTNQRMDTSRHDESSEDVRADNTAQTTSKNKTTLTPAIGTKTTILAPPTTPASPLPPRQAISKASELHSDPPRIPILVTKEEVPSPPSLNGQNLPDQPYEKSNTAEAFDETPSSAFTTTSNSLGQKFMVVIIGIVVSIVVLVLLVSRKVLQETDDSLEDSGYF